LTDDDPHEEDPSQIRRDVRKGIEQAVADGGTVEVFEIPDRKDAIKVAILGALPGDTVLLAGRGHETAQPVAGGDIPLDDRVEARNAIAARPASAARIKRLPQ
jgi:UDP-N-acetylmuramoyl-L-alanyl-D-glutamate--2,6-diaminopimelate ligase